MNTYLTELNTSNWNSTGFVGDEPLSDVGDCARIEPSPLPPRQEDDGELADASAEASDRLPCAFL